jgi:hypothetical protein
MLGCGLTTDSRGQNTSSENRPKRAFNFRIPMTHLAYDAAGCSLIVTNTLSKACDKLENVTTNSYFALTIYSVWYRPIMHFHRSSTVRLTTPWPSPQFTWERRPFVLDNRRRLTWSCPEIARSQPLRNIYGGMAIVYRRHRGVHPRAS